MGESEDCSHLVMSGGEELREIAPSSLVEQMEVDGEESPSRNKEKEKVDGAECSAELSPLDEEEATFPNPLLEEISLAIAISPPLSPLNENSGFENPLFERSSSAPVSSPLMSPLKEDSSFENPLLENILPATSAASSAFPATNKHGSNSKH